MRSLVGSAKRACSRIRLLAPLDGPLARVLDGEAGDDRGHLAHHVVPASPRAASARTADRRTAGRGRWPIRVRLACAPRPSRTAPSSASSSRPALMPRGVRRREERERGDVAEPERDHLQDDRREVRPQDLRIRVLRAASRSPPPSRGGSRCRRSCARRGPSAGSRDACEIASIGSRCTLARTLYREMRAVPPSMTARMPGTVRLVSATFVASTIRRADARGARTARRRGAARRRTGGRRAAGSRPAASARRTCRGARRRRRGSRSRRTGTRARRRICRARARRGRRSCPPRGRGPRRRGRRRPRRRPRCRPRRRAARYRTSTG